MRFKIWIRSGEQLKMVKLTKSPLPVGTTIKTENDYRRGIIIEILAEDKNTFIDYEISKEEMLTLELKIADKIPSGKNILYAISIKLDDSIENWQSQIDAFKTQSILINNC